MIRRRRTKWHRRGAATADALVGFLAVVALAVWQLFVSVISTAVRMMGRARTKTVGEAKRSVSVRGRGRQTPRFSSAPVPNIRFDSVAGLLDTKEEILVRTIYPLQHPECAAEYKVESGGGILLWGPPGCGKTLLAKAVAGELDANFYHVRASALIDQWVGEAEKNVAALFRQVRSHDRSVLFIDEIDAICPSRRRNRSTVMRRVIAEFLSQMDGFDTDGGRGTKGGFHLVLGATNWPEALDEAILRPGRFDHCVFVDLPDVEARRHIIKQRLLGRPVAEELTIEEVVSQTHGFSGADVANLIETAAREAFLESIRSESGNHSIKRQHWRKALAETQPSVSAAEIRRYQEWRQGL